MRRVKRPWEGRRDPQAVMIGLMVAGIQCHVAGHSGFIDEVTDAYIARYQDSPERTAWWLVWAALSEWDL